MEQSDSHFQKIFLYVCATTIVVLIYVCAITFIEIPEKNQRFVDIALAFLLGFISNNSSYLTGGNPNPIKKQGEPGKTTADISATIVTEPSTENLNDK